MSERSEGYSDGYAAGLRWGKRDGDRLAAEAARELHKAQADRDRLAATVDRVRELMADAKPLMTVGGEVPGIVTVTDLLAALKGDS